MIPDLKTDRKPILIAGPTASGKSGLALLLAERLKGAIVNADALQVYGAWRVLTARPDAGEEARAPHFLYGHIALNASYSVGHWLREVEACIDALRDRDLRPIIVGGTGLYFQALTRGLADIPAVPAGIRQEADRIIAASGAEALAEQLREEDPATYSRIDINNPARTQRAWEVLRATGRGLTDWHSDTPPPLLPLDAVHALHLQPATDWLNQRIDTRFDQMLEMGALDECKNVLDSGWDPSHPSCQAIGARELIGYLQGDMPLNDAVEQAKIQTRQYAKRQRTWFRSKMRDWTKVEIPIDENQLLRD